LAEILTTVRVTHIRIDHRLYPVTSYGEASAMFRAALARWPRRHADDVPRPTLCDADGRDVGYVTASGHCWIGRRGNVRAICVYTPAS
jgi:hypothetical protein